MIQYLAMALFFGGGAVAGSHEDLDALELRVAESLGAAPEPIDRRIKLAVCPEEPVISAPVGGAVSVRCEALGWKLRVSVGRPAARGEAGPAAMLVHRGDAIEVVVVGPGYAASAVGTALDGGSAGSTIRVKIPTSAQPVSAIVSRPGVASMSN